MLEENKFYFFKSKEIPWLCMGKKNFKKSQLLKEETEGYEFLYPVNDNKKEWMTLLGIREERIKEIGENKIDILNYYEGAVLSKKVYAIWKKKNPEMFQALKQIYNNALEKSLEAQN